ncbi:MAG: hypothetical protein IJ530_13615 [Treponema sp.]|uniref:hypothetical protein n=1 Tax=Treponema sp. TaxID=166 RepID=UPI0025F95631|nr:hypothetical protein [Treponema sp.]MBQ8680769.1 hypothetical protein [Treponema sp.]
MKLSIKIPNRVRNDKLPVFVALAVAGLFSVSCSKNDVPKIAEVEEPIPVETFVDGKILSKSASLCLFGRDSEMHSVIKLYAGADISVLEINGVIDTKFVPDKNALKEEENLKEQTNDSSESAENALSEEIKGTEFVHVVHDNLDFWLEKSVFALNCENAVAIEKTFLYADETLSQKIDSPQNPLKFAARIAKAKEENSENSESPKSVKIFYYDTGAKSVREAFVSSASISARIDDIVVSQVAEELKVTKRAAPRNELFAKAAKYKPCQKVLAALNAQKTDKVVNNYQEVLKSMQRMSFGVNVDELLTVDQSKDPFK